MDDRRFNLLSNLIGYHKCFMGKNWSDYWEDSLYMKQYKEAPESDDFTDIALKVGAKMPLDEIEKNLLTILARAFKDGYCESYDEHDKEELDIIFDGEPPSSSDIDQLVLEVTSI